MSGGCIEDVEGWVRATCAVCHKPFPQREEYERHCMVCYKGAKSYNLLVGDLSFFWAQRELADAEARLEVAEQKMGFEETFLKKLISLVHPDKHDGCPVATAVTQELLAMRPTTHNKRKNKP